MGGQPPESSPNGMGRSRVTQLPLSYDADNHEESARRLILAVRPHWGTEDSRINLIRCKEGITNTLLKVVNLKEGQTVDDAEKSAILLRAYGRGTDVLIDREREAENHESLWEHGLAPELLARFQNGMLYRYIRGRVATTEELGNPDIYRAVASRLAMWHATMPTTARKSRDGTGGVWAVANGHANGISTARKEQAEKLSAGKPASNLWTVTSKWVLALPTGTEAQRERQSRLQRELDVLIRDFSQRPGLGRDNYVFAHCDLLHGNIIIEPARDGKGDAVPCSVSFIDYEYATPSAVAFDIANHFAEWAGFDCKYELLPSRTQRLDFIRHYIESYFDLLSEKPVEVDLEAEANRLFDEVDLYRGIPGFYWGVWALIQAVISGIDFDYASYAECRLAEYWAWRGEVDGSREASDLPMPPREKRWAEV